MGGTVKTVDDGRARVNRLNELLALEDRAAASFEALMVGIETSRATLDRAFAIADAAVAAGARGLSARSEAYRRRRGGERGRYRRPASSRFAAVRHAGPAAH